MALWLLITFCLNSYNSRTPWEVASQGFSLMKAFCISSVGFCFHIASWYTLVLKTLLFHKPSQCFCLVAVPTGRCWMHRDLFHLLHLTGTSSMVLLFNTDICFFPGHESRFLWLVIAALYLLGSAAWSVLHIFSSLTPFLCLSSTNWQWFSEAGHNILFTLEWYARRLSILDLGNTVKE